VAFPLQCYAWFVGSLIRILCVGYCVAEMDLPVSILLGQFDQRSLLVSGAAGGGVVTYCYRSLSCDGHSLVLCGCLCLLVRATSVWLECTFAEQSAVCFVPMGMRPSPFSIRVPCTHSLCRILLCESGSTCVPSFNACSISLDPFAAALRFWSLSCLTDGDCGRCLHTVIGLCGPHPRPLLLAMLCSLCGLFMLCFLRGLSVWNPAHLESAHFFAGVRSRSFADTNFAEPGVCFA
jgi:hypothetical protein